MSGQCRATHLGMRCCQLAGDRHPEKHEYRGHVNGRFAWIITTEKDDE